MATSSACAPTTTATVSIAMQPMQGGFMLAPPDPGHAWEPGGDPHAPPAEPVAVIRLEPSARTALDLFDGRAITLDHAERQVVVESRETLEDRTAGMREVPMREARPSSGALLEVFLGVGAEAAPLWFELDPDNHGHVLIAPHAAARLGLELSKDEPRTVTLRIPGFGLVTVQALEKEMIYEGRLNAAFLREHRVTLDLEAERAWIERAGT